MSEQQLERVERLCQQLQAEVHTLRQTSVDLQRVVSAAHQRDKQLADRLTVLLEQLGVPACQGRSRCEV